MPNEHFFYANKVQILKHILVGNQGLYFSISTSPNFLRNELIDVSKKKNQIQKNFGWFSKKCNIIGKYSSLIFIRYLRF